jgi:hypothetical protein
MKMRTDRATVSSVVLWLGCVIIFVGAVAGQSENTASAIGVEAIKRVLTEHDNGGCTGTVAALDRRD